MAMMYVDGRWQDVSGDSYYQPPPSNTGPYRTGAPADPGIRQAGAGSTFGQNLKPYTPPKLPGLPNIQGPRPNFSPFAPVQTGAAQIDRTPSPAYPNAPTPPGGVGPLGPLPPYNPRLPTSDGAVQAAIGRLRPFNFDPMPREQMAAPPQRVDSYGGIGPAPDNVNGYNPLGPAPSRGSVDALTGQLASSGQLAPMDRATLGGPARNNVWENLALGRLSQGTDPGQQFTGRDVPDKVFSPGEEQLIASQQAAPTLRAFQDAQSQIAAAAASNGRSVDPGAVAALQARAMIENAGAMGAAQGNARIVADRANAQQAAVAAENARQNFNTDISSRLGLGRLSLDTAGQEAQTGMQLRGLNQARDIEGFQGNIQQRGQDLTQQATGAQLRQQALSSALQAQLGARGQDIGYAETGGQQGLEARGQDVTQRGQTMDYNVAAGNQALGARGQDVTQRGQDIGANESAAQLQVTQRAQDLQQQYEAAGLTAQQAQAAVQAQLSARGQTINENLGIGSQNLEARGQDVNAMLGARGQDINQELGLGNLNLGTYEAQNSVTNAIADRNARMDTINAQLQDASLDRNSRAQLQQQQYQLQQEIAALNQQQQEADFARNYGLDQQRIALQQAQLGETGRQFDANNTMGWAGLGLNSQLGLGRLNIDYGYANQAGAFNGPPDPNAQYQQMQQLAKLIAQYQQQAA